MVAALYARVSTIDKSQDVQLQLSELRDYANKRGWTSIEYIDDGVSGVSSKRPAFNKLIVDAKKRKIDAIVISRLDRFGRSLSQLIMVMAEMQSLGIEFISLKESLDFSTASGRLMANLLAVFADYERELIRERVCAGIAHAKSKGKVMGRKPIEEKIRKKVITIHVSEPTLSVRKLSEKSSVSASTVHRILQVYRQNQAG